MSYINFSEEQKLQAASIDLANFLATRGEKLIRSGSDWRLESDKSITIRNNMWYDHAAERGGNAISFVREIYGSTYPEAMSLLLGDEHGEAYKLAEKTTTPQDKKPFILPTRNSDMRRVYAYLLKQRYIDRDVLTHFAKEKLVFEDAKHHNVVFLGCDENNIPRHAHNKSTASNSNFRINVEGSDPAYSFHHIGTSSKLYVFEGPIDMLSFVSLYKHEWEIHSYISLCGVSDHAMLKMLELYPHLKSVVLCLDHDVAGIENCQKLADVLEEHDYIDVKVQQSKFKDWNEDIKALHGLDAAPAEEHPQLLVCSAVFNETADNMNNTKSDCSFKNLKNMFEQIRINLHSGKFETADHCLQSMAAVSLLLAKQQHKHLEQDVSNSQLILQIQNSFKPYQNRGKLQSRIDDIKQELTRIDALQGVVTQSQKEQLISSYKTLALSCTKALVLSEVARQPQDQEINQNINLSM